MPDRTIAVLQGEAGLNQLSIDLIEEAELDRIRCIAPDGEVAATFSEGGPKGSRIGWMHWASLPCAQAYPSVTSRS